MLTGRRTRMMRAAIERLRTSRALEQATATTRPINWSTVKPQQVEQRMSTIPTEISRLKFQQQATGQRQPGTTKTSQLCTVCPQVVE